MKILVVVLTFGLAGPALAGATASAALVDTTGRPVGEAHFKAAPHGVLIELSVHGLPPGPHAVLLHARGACDPNIGFQSAGPVFDFETPRGHGYFAKNGSKAGDLPQQFAGGDGLLHASFYTTAISLGDGRRSIFGRDGVSIIIHAAGDDYRSQPEGGAGARLACGIIRRLSGTAKRHR